MYHEVRVNMSPPFLIVDKMSTRVRADISGEDEGPMEQSGGGEPPLPTIAVQNVTSPAMSASDNEGFSTREDIRQLLSWLD